MLFGLDFYQQQRVKLHGLTQFYQKKIFFFHSGKVFGLANKLAKSEGFKQGQSKPYILFQSIPLS